MKDPNIIQQLLEMLLGLIEWIKNLEIWFTFSQRLGALFDAFCNSYPEFIKIIKDICETVSAHLWDIVYWFNQVFHDLYSYCYTKICKWDDAITKHIAEISEAIDIWWILFTLKHRDAINALFNAIDALYNGIDKFFSKIAYNIWSIFFYIYVAFPLWAAKVPLDKLTISALIVKFYMFLQIHLVMILSIGWVSGLIFGFYDVILLFNFPVWYQPQHDWLLYFFEHKHSWAFYSEDLPMSIKNVFSKVSLKISESHWSLVAENKRIYSEFFNAPIDFCKDIKTSFFSAGESGYYCLKDKAIQIYDFFILCHDWYLNKCTAHEVVQATFGSQIAACDAFWLRNFNVVLLHIDHLFDAGFRFPSPISFELFLAMFPLPIILFLATVFWGSFFLVISLYNSSRLTKCSVIVIMFCYLFFAFIFCPIFY